MWRHRRSKNSVRIYLVRAEVDGIRFQKIGLHSGVDVLDRDRKAYKEVLRSVQITHEKAGVTENIALALCSCRHSFDWDLFYQIPDSWSGRTEAITTDEDITGTFDEALAICAAHTPQQLNDELVEIWNLHSEVVWVNPLEEGKPLPARVRRLREALGLESWISRVRWCNEHQWAIGLNNEAVYWYVTGKRLERIRPKSWADGYEAYSLEPYDFESLRRAVESMQEDGVDLSKFSAEEDQALTPQIKEKTGHRPR